MGRQNCAFSTKTGRSSGRRRRFSAHWSAARCAAPADPFTDLPSIQTDGDTRLKSMDRRLALSPRRFLDHLFCHRVLQMLLRERRIDETQIRKLLGWFHSGFSLHNEVRIGSHDSEGRRAVSEYILWSPFSQEKLRYHAKTGTMIYRSKMHPVLKRNFEVFSACDWLAALTAHIPNAGEHLVRYYGWYSNVSRGKRRKTQGENQTPIGDSIDVSAAAAKRAWARLITQVYEVDPLVCPRCGGGMQILAFIKRGGAAESFRGAARHYPLPAP